MLTCVHISDQTKEFNGLLSGREVHFMKAVYIVCHSSLLQDRKVRSVEGDRSFQPVVVSCSPPAAEYALALYASFDSFDSLPSRAGLGGLFVAPPLEDCLTGLMGSSTRAGTGCTELQLIGSSVADCQELT